ncbi:transcription elongation factor-like protein s-ii [Lophiostoma macrostomum CBS 122681]|uniref:Transcription elongation factor n=1 Tax=Lophiostoma macrostomum CBS 122681 TaxID=1314788 RepID=A0A6A6TUT9_9PLEO|nr:transcription elongation factor-like protein s-ii [Lophiostoma macrostomum CBS 122681]
MANQYLRQVEEHGKLITKALNGGEPSSSILKLLGDLKGGVRANEELLRQTRIGVTINRLRQHKDPAVAKMSTELVSKWREDVGKLKKSKPSAAGTPKTHANGTSSPAPPPSGTASPAPSKRKHNVDPAKRSHKTDKIDYNVTGDLTRDNCIRLMYDGLAFMSDELPDEILGTARNVEAAAYKKAGSTSDAYKQKMRSLFQNLKSKSNPGLRKRVLSGAIAPERFVTMSHDEMKSDERRAEDERLEKENMNSAMVAQVEKSISKEFQCSKCKQRMVSYSQAQTRSADEPMTTFCECMNCGNRWKFS